MKELCFLGSSFDFFADTQEPPKFASFAAVCKDFRMELTYLPKNLAKFGEFLCNSECANIEIDYFPENAVGPFAEWVILLNF